MKPKKDCKKENCINDMKIRNKKLKNLNYNFLKKIEKKKKIKL